LPFAQSTGCIGVFFGSFIAVHFGDCAKCILALSSSPLVYMRPPPPQLSLHFGSTDFVVTLTVSAEGREPRKGCALQKVGRGVGEHGCKAATGVASHATRSTSWTSPLALHTATVTRCSPSAQTEVPCDLFLSGFFKGFSSISSTTPVWSFVRSLLPGTVRVVRELFIARIRKEGREEGKINTG